MLLYIKKTTNILCFIYNMCVFIIIFLSEHIGISNHLLQQFYLEILKITNTPFEIERRYNETQVLAWNNMRCSEHLVEIGLMEKYTQTD